MIDTPEAMAPLLTEKNIENIFFKKFLRNQTSSSIDEFIHQSYPIVSAQINCLECANCCKKLEPGIEQTEISELAQLNHQLPEVFKQNHVAYDGDAYYLKAKPCLFLTDNMCSIYNNRPQSCSGYPHLDQKDMKFRRTFWENYAICPIVFNVIESLKVSLGFPSKPIQG